MQTSEHLKTVMNELLQTTALIADDEAEQLVNGIISSKKSVCHWSRPFRSYGQVVCYAYDAYGH